MAFAYLVPVAAALMSGAAIFVLLRMVEDAKRVAVRNTASRQSRRHRR